MAYLKEDGSLDIERYINLPYDEYLSEYNKLTPAQRQEYNDNLPICKKGTSLKARKINYSFEESIRKGIIVDFDSLVEKLKTKYWH